MQLYDLLTETDGLTMLPKLKYEHVHLTPFSKMRVDLATQVLIFSTLLNFMCVIGVE